MKRILLFLILLLVFVNCSKDSQEVKEVKKDPKEIKPCQVPPPDFILLINKSSELYKEFTNQAGEIDKANISFYKQFSREEKQYDSILFGSFKPEKNNDYLQIIIGLPFENDVYTGKTETLYLQNATRTYKIEVNGYMKDTECGKYVVTNEIRVDGTKIEVPYLAK